MYLSRNVSSYDFGEACSETYLFSENVSLQKNELSTYPIKKLN